MFGSPSVWLVKLQNALSFSPLFPPRYLRFIFFFSLFLLPCRYVLCLKAGAPSQAMHRVWMCSDTSSSQSLISQGEMGVWHVYILFPFLCRIKNPPLYFRFPTTLKTTHSETKTDADPSLTP